MTDMKLMKIYEGDRFKKKKHLREHQLNVTIFSRKFSKPSNQTIDIDRSLTYYQIKYA